MSGLNESQQYTTCESARQHFHQLTAGQWEGSWSRFPKRPILAYSTYKSANVKLIHKQVLHNCEMSQDLITNQVNSPTRGPLCLQNGKHSGRRKDSHRNPLGEKNHFQNQFCSVLERDDSAIRCLVLLPNCQRVAQRHSPPPRSPLCAQKAVQIARGENKRTSNKVSPRALSKQHLLCKVILECPQA